MSDVNGRGQSRRDFLLKGAAAAAGVVAGSELALARGAFAGAESSAAAISGSIMPPLRTPRKGGVLRIGAATGSASDTLDVAASALQVDFMRAAALYGTLLESNVHNHPIPALAEEISSNAKADEWTVRLRHGVEFHNGKSLTVDDLIYSLQRNFALKSSLWGPPLALFGFDLKSGVKKLDRLTVRFKLKHPYSVFDQFPFSKGYFVVPVGYDPKHPVGTGPFKLKRFTPGQESVFVANRNYFGHPPYVDELVIVDLPDDNARVNALLSGQVDAIQVVPLGAIEQIKKSSSVDLMVTPTGDWNPLVMRMDTRPFQDVRVRQAFRLLIDRNVMLQQAVGGYGTVANDLFCPLDPVFAHDLPQRKYDPERAKSLLKAAGYDKNLSVELITSPLAIGLVETCRVFQAQAAAVGVKVKLTQIDQGSFFGKQFLQRPFTVDFYQYPIDYFPMTGFTDGTNGAIFNETHNHNAKFHSLFQQGLRTTNQAKRKSIAHEMQRIEHDSGGYVIPFYPSLVEAASKKTAGWQAWPNYVGMNGYHFEYLGLV